MKKTERYPSEVENKARIPTLIISIQHVLEVQLGAERHSSLSRAAANSVTYNRNVVSYGSGSSCPEGFHWVRNKVYAGWKPSRRIGLLSFPAFKAAFLGA